MGKFAGSWPNVIGGVSEQVAQSRRPGQHAAQDNMVSDAVRGIARRHGGVALASTTVRSDTSNFAAMLADMQHHNTHQFSDTAGNFFDLIYRTKPAVSAPAEQAGNFCFCYAYSTKQYLPVQVDAADPLVAAAIARGVGAITNAGRYLVMAAADTPTSYTTSSPYAGTNQGKLAVWIRSGAYARTYTVTVTKNDGSLLTVSYKTKQSSYPELLDTSGIPLYKLDGDGNPIVDAGASESAGTTIYVSDPEYTKKVNDVVNAYNSAATAWIGEAAQDIVPANIAQKLADLLVAASVPCTVIESTIVFDTDAGIKEVSASDGGDDTSVHSVGNTITDPADITSIHWVGKVVKVTPATGTSLQQATSSDSFYLQAVAADGVSTGWAKVNWVETAGFVQQPTSVFLLATVQNGTFYVAGTPARLAEMTGISTVPTYAANKVGDAGTVPAPLFLGRVVTYLGMFQDRLVVGTGSTLFFSRSGDYFNWFRGSVLDVADNDPIELQAQGSENDTIRRSVVYNRDPIFFGDRLQYAMNGQQIATPATAALMIASAHSDAVEADPTASGNYVFYCKRRGDGHTTLHQVQVGLLETAPESYELSSALVDYLEGTPVELAALEAPDYVFLRTTNQDAVYTYTYVDQPGSEQRLSDSWSRWTWSALLGKLVGLSTMEGYPIMHFAVANANGVQLRAVQFTVESRLADYPYLDFILPLGNTLLTTGVNVAYGRNAALPFVGTESYASYTSDLANDSGVVDTTELYTGYPFTSSLTITNPYLRDSNGAAITNGRFTLMSVGVNVASTGGLTSTVTTANGNAKVLDWGGYFVGRASGIVGQQPLVDTRVAVGVGREVRECTVTLASKTWLPLNIIALDWTAQLFNNTRRA